MCGCLQLYSSLLPLSVAPLIPVWIPFSPKHSHIPLHCSVPPQIFIVLMVISWCEHWHSVNAYMLRWAPVACVLPSYHRPGTSHSLMLQPSTNFSAGYGYLSSAQASSSCSKTLPRSGFYSTQLVLCLCEMNVDVEIDVKSTAPGCLGAAGAQREYTSSIKLYFILKTMNFCKWDTLI